MSLSIETEDLGKRYGNIRAVEHLSLRVAEGEIYAFLGLNGAVSPANRIAFGAIGVGNRARAILPNFLAFPEIQFLAVSDCRDDRLKSAKEAGELPPEFEPEVVAQIIGTYLQGLYRTALLWYDRPRLERQIDEFLTCLGL